ncbi:Alpha-aminoadipate aminotransferase [Hyphodiscus hymeniophilus]|uniref:Alpha-aminoadipate aminotransferase n=1 Tax=Hyphodiscus hymeniophilus TaxID=353542 RepID=A0A9P7B0W2_9HELO|nr:Alpha-aminoadipate aminotransferase [Hyphodiscus hymeniophilus]
MGGAPKKQINLLRGWPNPALLPTTQIKLAADAALSDSSVSTPGLLYGPDPGYQPLRQSLAGWLDGFYRHTDPTYTTPLSSPQYFPNGNGNRGESGRPDAERICITGGASQNLACLLQVFTDPLYTKVWMVAPCYFLACRIFDDAGLRVSAVGEGSEGVDLVALEKGLKESESNAFEETKSTSNGFQASIEKLKQPKPWSKIYRHIIYCVPTFSNPSGKTMTLSHRVSLVKLARKYNALIIADDVYDFLQWPTSSSSPTLSTSPSSLRRALLPRLVDIDRMLDPIPNSESFGNAVSNGSFSKIAGPGVRTGWAEATRKFTYGLSQCGSSRSGGAPSQMTATIVNELLVSSALQTHIDTVLKPAYQKRFTLMIEAIKRELVPLGVSVAEDTVNGKDGVFGGYFIWIELPKGMDAEVVAGRAKEEEELILAPGKIFEVQGDERVKFPNGLRLCFSWEEEQDLVDGVRRLGRVVKELMEGKGGTGEAKVDKQDLGEFQ